MSQPKPAEIKNIRVVRGESLRARLQIDRVEFPELCRTVSIGGQELDNASVTIGSATAVVMMNTPNTLVVTSPPGAAGPADVIVTTPGGSARGGYTYQ